MRKFIISIAITAAVALGGVTAWQAEAAAPAGAIPLAGPYTPIHPADCSGTTGAHGCGPGYFWRNGARGWACYRC